MAKKVPGSPKDRAEEALDRHYEELRARLAREASVLPEDVHLTPPPREPRLPTGSVPYLAGPSIAAAAPPGSSPPASTSPYRIGAPVRWMGKPAKVVVDVGSGRYIIRFDETGAEGYASAWELTPG